MPPFRRWADLQPDLLRRNGNRLDLQWYASARGACTVWRCGLPPPSPSLLVALDYPGRCTSAASLPTRRPFWLTGAILSRGRCMGSSNGWLALSVGGQGMFSLLNPITATDIVLPPLAYGSRWVSKLVFVLNPTPDDFTATSICDINRLAYVTAGAKMWAILDPVRFDAGDQLADIVYHEEGRVYCLTRYGDVHVLRLPEHRRREAFMVEDAAGPSSGPVMLWCPAARAEMRLQRMWDQQHRDMLFRRSVGPDLNAPATVEPLLLDDGGDLPVDPAASFTTPYDTISFYTSAKHLVFCEGNLVWRNASCTVSLKLPGGGRRRVVENEVLVLRYYRPQSQTCWDAVTDLGGYSVFVGKNNAVAMYAHGVLGLKGNSVYWISGTGIRAWSLTWQLGGLHLAFLLIGALR